MRDKFKTLALSLSMGVFVLGFGISQASAEVITSGYTYFETEDGQYEKTVPISSSVRSTGITIKDIKKIDRNSGVYTPYDDATPLKVRLCSASTGNCTGFKSFESGGLSRYSAFWVGMIPGTYRVDIVDTWSNYRFAGQVQYQQ